MKGRMGNASLLVKEQGSSDDNEKSVAPWLGVLMVVMVLREHSSVIFKVRRERAHIVKLRSIPGPSVQRHQSYSCSSAFFRHRLQKRLLAELPIVSLLGPSKDASTAF